MKFIYNDGGRADAGFAGKTGDCACRAAAIATQRPYKEVYDLINKFAKAERTGKRKYTKSNARTGVYQVTFKKVMEHYGFTWVPTMQIGQGCTVHLRESELPKGRIVCNVSKHYTAVIDGVINDTYDCSRDGDRCVYGYFINKQEEMTAQESKKKAAFVRNNLAPMLRAAGVNIADAVYRKDPATKTEIVTLTYACGTIVECDVTADSLITIVQDVIKKI